MIDQATDIEALGQALSALGRNTRSVGGLDGLLAAILTCPEPIPPEEWFPFIWDFDDDDDDPAMEETPETVAALGEILKRYNRIAYELQHGGEAFAPLYEVDSRHDDTLWEIWAEGFEVGMSLRPDAWLPILAVDDDRADALRLLITLCQLADNDRETKAELGPDQVKLLTDGAPDLLPECVQVLFDTARPPGTPIVRGPKIGRNDPCPCGSGKKFKKCCGAT